MQVRPKQAALCVFWTDMVDIQSNMCYYTSKSGVIVCVLDGGVL